MAADKTVLTDKTQAQVVGEADQNNLIGVKSVKSVLSVGGISGEASDPATHVLRTDNARTAQQSDAETYLAFLRDKGPATYGAAAVALDWGATRAWQAEARLRAAGLVSFEKSGRAAPAIAEVK